MWAKIGGFLGVLSLIGILIALSVGLKQIAQSNEASRILSTQLALLQQQLDVQSELVTLQVESPEPGETATFIAQRMTELVSTNAALETLQVSQGTVLSNLFTGQVDGPFRDHATVSIGNGVFEVATFSDGLAQYSEDWLWANDHINIQLIRKEEFPDGCGSAQYQVDRIWVSAGSVATITVNGREVGKITTITPLQKHGYVVELSLNIGDDICITPIPPSGFHIIFGPDIYYHYDSYCFRGHC